jgi:hypothetical protein
MSKQIKIKCTGTENVPINKFIELQGNLKDLSTVNYEKLKSSILKYGFSFPVFCWKDKNKYYILDAHQRINVLRKLQKEENYIIPDLPTCYIEADNRKQAKEKLLLLNSNYGKINEEGFYEFLNEPNFEIDFESIKTEIDLPNIDLERFELGYVNPKNNDKEINETDLKIECECPKCGYKW